MLHIERKSWFELEMEEEDGKWTLLGRFDLALEASNSLKEMREKFPILKHRLKYIRVIEKVLNL